MLPRSQSFTVWFLALLALAATCRGATFLAEGYALRVWQTEDGLPQNMVTSGVQTRDGYLWLGTYSGLARFDGERFQVFDPVNTPGLTDRRITCLFEDADGDLWIGHESGAVTRYHLGKFERARVPSGPQTEKTIGIGSDEQGRLWVMRQGGRLDAVEGQIQIPSLIPEEKPGVMAWSRARGGSIWLAENGTAAQLRDGALQRVALPAPKLYNYVLGIAASPDGGAWILCDDLVRRWKDGQWVEHRGAFPWNRGPLACSLQLRDGTLAVGTIYSGLYLFFRDGRRPVHFDRSNGLPQNWVRFLQEDREGNLWVGAGSAGVVSIHATAFSVLNSPDQWQGCSVLSVAPGRNGDLWIGTDGAGLYHHSGGAWANYRAAEGLHNVYIPSVAEGANGEVWASSFWWGGPYRLENGKFVSPDYVDPASSPIFALLPIAPDDLIVGNREGLLELKNHRSEWLYKSPDDSRTNLCAIERDGQGGVWGGFEQGGLVHVVNGKATSYHRSDGLASEAVQCLFADVDGALWIGTADRGLCRLKNGRFSQVGVEQGLVDQVVCRILDDGLGYFWLSTHHGLQRIAKDELNRCADGLIRSINGHVYDASDGLPTVEFSGGLQASGCKTADGRLWFASGKGVLCVDPARIESNPTPPPVVVEAMRVDGRPWPIDGSAASIHLHPAHQRLEFRFTGLSFVAPGKVLFKYRLDGIDQDWVEAGPRRTAFYSRLAAGTYRFRVIACNNDGLWNTQGASLVFAVAPFFWQTWWFVGLSVLVAATLVALFARYLTRRRMQRKIEQMERQHELERERARIAQDIHDDVGASLSRIAMLSQPGHGDLEAPERAAAMLSRVYTTARDVMRALDEIVWAVDPRHDTLDSLVDYMGKFAQDFLATAQVRCRLDLPVTVPAWPLTAETRHNLFLAFKEALNNAVKHAAATEVRISFKLLSDSFELAVRDNGRGFAPGESGSGDAGRLRSGHGLLNMQRRLKRIGGRCEISSQKDQGTSVSLIVSVAGHVSRHPAESASSPPTGQ